MELFLELSGKFNLYKILCVKWVKNDSWSYAIIYTQLYQPYHYFQVNTSTNREPHIHGTTIHHYVNQDLILM